MNSFAVDLDRKQKIVNILLVDDNVTDVKILLRAFHEAKLACRVFTAMDGEEALTFLKSQSRFSNRYKISKPDIIIVDLKMPRMDGHTFIKKVKSMNGFSSTPVIVHAHKEDIEQVPMIEGVRSYYPKSIDSKALIARINTLFQPCPQVT